MKPEDIAKANTEHAHQCALFCWASQFPELKYMFAIPNGGERNPIVAARLKAEGVKSGVSDIMLPLARGKFHGLFIELKKPAGSASQAGKESTAQIAFGNYLSSQNYAYTCSVGWEAARDVLINYLSLPTPD